MDDQEFDLAVMLRKSIGGEFRKISDDIKKELISFWADKIDDLIKSNNKEINLSFPDEILNKINRQPKVNVNIPKTFKLDDEDIKKLKPQKLIIPEKLKLDENTIEKIKNIIPKNDSKTSIKKLLESFFDDYSNNPNKYINVRLTDGSKFYEAVSQFIQGIKTSDLAKENTLSAIKKQVDKFTFSNNKLLTTTSGGSNDIVGINNSNDNRIDPATQQTVSGTQTILEDIRSNKFDVNLSVIAKESTLNLILTELELKADLDETQPISAVSLPLPSGAATAANQQTDALTDSELRASDVKVTLDNEQVDIKALGAVGNGQKTVTTAGTAVALGSSTTIRSVTIKALAGNTNNVYVGDSNVNSSNGFVLDAGETVSLDIDNLADVYIDSDTDGEGVSFIYLI